MQSAEPTQLTLKIKQTENFSQVCERLRQVSLVGDPAQKPYAQAEFSLREVSAAEVFPLSRYILTDHLDTQRYLHWAFEQEHNLNTLHQEDERLRILFTLEGSADEWALIPPIVEESKLDGKPLLVDGEHRFFLAKELGVPIRVIWISHVPTHYPVVATPISWSEVKEYAAVPPLAEKRDYRYPTLADFPDISPFSAAQVTADNYLYFFFRDLSPVCTSGVRRVGTT